MIRQEAVAAILAPPIKDIVIPPPPRTPAEHRSRAKWGMGGLAAVPLVAWARDRVPVTLAIAAVGGVLTFTPSPAPYVTPLPPQAEGPTVTAPPLGPRPDPPTADVERDEEPETTQEQGRAQVPVVAPESAEPPATPPDTQPPTEPPPPSRSEPPSQPPPEEPPPTEPPPEEEPPDCAEALPELDVDDCLDDVDEVVSGLG